MTCGSSGPAIALSVGLSWPPDRRRRSADAPAGSSSGNVLFRSTSSTTTSSRMLSAYSGRSGGNQQTPSLDRSHTRRSPAPALPVPPQAAPAAPSTPAAALVEDEPSSSTAKRRKVQVDPIMRDWLLGMTRQNGDGAYLGAWVRSSACALGCSTGINQRKRSAPRAAPLGRKTFAVTRRRDTAQRAHHAGDRTSCASVGSRSTAWCSNGSAQRDTTSVLASGGSDGSCAARRVVNIDETSCRLLPVHQIGWGRRGVKQAQLQGNTKEATTFTVAFSKDRGPLDMLVQIVHASKTDAALLEQPWPERTHHVTSENGWATTTNAPAAHSHIGHRAEPEQRTSVDPSLGPASNASEATLAAMRAAFPHVVLCFLPPRSTSYLQPCPQLQAPLLPAPSSTARSKAWP